MTMTPEEEFRVQELERQVMSLRQVIGRWRVNQADSFFQESGFQFGDKIDMGNLGIQLLTPASSALGDNRGIIWFIPEASGFLPSVPPATGAYGELRAGINGSNATIVTTAYNSTRTSYAYISIGANQVTINALNQFGSTTASLAMDGSGLGQGRFVVSSSGAAQIRVVGGTADPDAQGAGAISYRTDTSKFRGYTSSWDNFAMEAWVTAAITPVSESYAHSLLLMGA